MATPACAKCGSDMEPGFLVDKSYGDSYASSPEWAEARRIRLSGRAFGCADANGIRSPPIAWPHWAFTSR